MNPLRSQISRFFAGGLAVAAALLAIPVSPAWAAAEDEDAAREILAAAQLQGGVVVHLGCGDGRLTAALRQSEAFQVQGLETDGKQVEAARETIRSRGLYGPVSADRFDGQSLPYIDNFVNLLVAEQLGGVSRDEALRVLAPGGAICLRQGGGWAVERKPRPAEIDDWTHYLYDPSNNAVSRDTAVDPPRHLQWLQGPRYSRHHDHMSAASAMVTAGGRLFYIFDHATPLSIQLASQWQLVARDAFNGTRLWSRDIDTWQTQMFRLKSGPAQLPRRLVALGDRVYVTLGLAAPVSELDAATGKTLREFAGTERTEEILVTDGMLLLVVGEAEQRQPSDPEAYSYDFQESPCRVKALEIASGRTLWDRPQPTVLPMTLTAGGDRVLFHDGERIVCVDRGTGEPRWKSEPLARRAILPSFFSPTLVLYEDVVLFSGGSLEGDDRNRGGGDNTMYGLSADTGATLWKAPHPPSGYKSPEDILVIGGLVWTPTTTVGSDTGLTIGRDPRTGEVRKEFLPDVETHWFHHRCYRAKATDKYLLTSRTGIEFVDPKTEHWECHHWVRGACLYGILPANGMIYNAPHPCACYLEAKLFGFNALAPARSGSRDAALAEAGSTAGRLEKGPAYADIGSPAAADASSDWPTYRGDASRSGTTAAGVPASVERAWEAKFGGRLSSVTVAGGRLYVAAVDEHAVVALDAGSGRQLWRFTAGSRVDSPPTIDQGRALFGSADGWVYCLRASDGVLAWRFRAAPRDLRMGAFEQIESVWPVHGSVLVRGDELWCVAGRSMFVDGGLRLIRLNPRDGSLIAERVLDDRDPDSGKNLQVRLQTLNMPVALPDILSCDGKYVYMRSQRFDLEGNRQEIEVPNLDVSAQRGEGPHLFCPTGFLDDVWWHRSYWVFGRVWKSGAGGYYQAGRVAPAGRPMVFDDSTVYSFGRKPEYYRWTTPMEYQLYATPKQPELLSARKPAAAEPSETPKRKPEAAKQKPKRKAAGVGAEASSRIAFDWSQEVPVLVRAMVLADRTLFLAGPPDLVDEEQAWKTFSQPSTQELLARQAAAYEGAEGARLWAVSAEDGTKLGEWPLDAVPVFDGMAAAGGRLFLATADGRVICYAAR